MNTAAPTYTLRNGTTHLVFGVRLVHLKLRNLLDSGMAIPFYELVMLARDPDHEVFGDCAAQFDEFMDSTGKLQGMVRDVVLACTEGDGLDIKLLSITESLAPAEEAPNEEE